MFKLILALTLALSLALTPALPVLAQERISPSARAIDFLKTKQNDDGGFSNGFAPESDLTTTADAVIAASLAGQDPETVFTIGTVTPLTYLETQVAGGQVSSTGQIAKVMLAVIAAGEDPEEFAGHNLVEDLAATQGKDGLFGAGAFDHCLAMIAQQTTEIEANGTVEALLGAQNEDGGWGFMAGEKSDTNTTGLCLQALALTESPEAVEAGFAYLSAIQNEDGGWPYQNPSEYGTDSDANSTALVIQALVANSEDLAEWNSPQDWLLSMQLESGAFSFQAAMPGDNVLATVAAIPALEAKPLNAWAMAARDE